MADVAWAIVLPRIKRGLGRGDLEIYYCPRGDRWGQQVAAAAGHGQRWFAVRGRGGDDPSLRQRLRVSQFWCRTGELGCAGGISGGL